MSCTRRLFFATVAGLVLDVFITVAPGVSYADHARFISDPKEALQVRVDLIQQARKEILVEYYSVWNDDQSAGGIALLIDAARRGVKVKVVLDALAHRIPTSIFAAMNAMSLRPDGTPGIEVRMYNSPGLNLFNLTNRDHSKMIIIDGQRLLTGGRNIGDMYFHQRKRGPNYDDFDILVDGKVVTDARHNFLSTWASRLVSPPNLGPHSEDELSPAKCFYVEGSSMSCEEGQAVHQHEVAKSAARLDRLLFEIFKRQRDDIVHANTGTDWLKHAVDVGPIKFLSHSPNHLVRHKTAFLTDEVFSLLKSARRSVDIVSPYLIPPEEALRIFAQLLARGVNIRVITNSLTSTDSVFAHAGYRYLKPLLVKMGVEIHEYTGPNTLHTKALLIDDDVVTVGSMNFDPRSFYINREVALEMPTPGRLALELKNQIAIYEAHSVLVAKYGSNENLKWQEEQDAKSNKSGYVGLLQLLMPVLIDQL